MFLYFFDSPCSESKRDVITIPSMSKPSQIIDDITQLAGGAAGVLGNLRQQIHDDVKARVEEIAERLNLVPREDLDRVEAMLAKALTEQKEMAERLDALEKKK